jgi:O-antigen/teichoic acid export membrane protein
MIALAGFYRLDQVLVRILAGAAQAGAYAAASRITLAANAVGALVAMAVLPDLSQAHAMALSATRRLRQSLILGTVLGTGVALLLVVFADHVVRLLFGAQYFEAAAMLRALAPVVMFNAVTVVANAAAAAFHRERQVVPRAFGLVVLNIVANLALIPMFGGLGAAAISSAGEMLLALWLLWIVRDVVFGRSATLALAESTGSEPPE